jgi:hypothetical protein
MILAKIRVLRIHYYGFNLGNYLLEKYNRASFSQLSSGLPTCEIGLMMEQHYVR